MAIGLGVIVAIAAALVAYFILWGSARFTECFATFESAEVAGRAIEATHDAGFDAELRPRSERVVVFSSGETGEDASEFRRAFQEVVQSHDGKPAHPGGGCLERPNLN